MVRARHARASSTGSCMPLRRMTTVFERSGSAEFRVGVGSGAENQLSIGDSSNNCRNLLRSARAFRPCNLTGALPAIKTGSGALSACTRTTTMDLPTLPGSDSSMISGSLDGSRLPGPHPP
jgi:hypothetical protein